MSKRGWSIIGVGILAYLLVASTATFVAHYSMGISVVWVVMFNYLVAAAIMGPAFAMATKI